jgi:cell division protein FtsB
MFKHKSSSVTRTLSSASFSLTEPPRSRGWLWGICLLALILFGASYAFRANSLSPEMALRNSIESLKQENQRLTQELKQQVMNFQHEQATREALERQLATQSEELKKARKDLSFYRENIVR